MIIPSKTFNISKKLINLIYNKINLILYTFEKQQKEKYEFEYFSSYYIYTPRIQLYRLISRLLLSITNLTKNLAKKILKSPNFSLLSFSKGTEDESINDVIIPLIPSLNLFIKTILLKELKIISKPFNENNKPRAYILYDNTEFLNKKCIIPFYVIERIKKILNLFVNDELIKLNGNLYSCVEYKSYNYLEIPVTDFSINILVSVGILNKFELKFLYSSFNEHFFPENKLDILTYNLKKTHKIKDYPVMYKCYHQDWTITTISKLRELFIKIKKN